MPSGWVHATVDLISFGRTYFHQHKKKDEPHKWLGWEHRRLRHKYYQLFGKKWDFNNPFPPWLKEITRQAASPGKAEQLQSYASHDYLDRIWDESSKEKRRWIEGLCIYVMSNLKLFRDWAGIDVNKGKIKRLVAGKEIWEDCPELIYEYKRLNNYVRKFKECSEKSI